MARTTHGMHKHPAYKRWIYMKMRCTSDPRYIAKGITVCDRWLHSFENFYADMGDPPPRHTLDRKDGTKGYSPDNCRWGHVQRTEPQPCIQCMDRRRTQGGHSAARWRTPQHCGLPST